MICAAAKHNAGAVDNYRMIYAKDVLGETR